LSLHEKDLKQFARYYNRTYTEYLTYLSLRITN